MKKIFLIKLTLLFVIFAFQTTPAQTSAFTYQGKLTDGSTPANGQYDFTFRLFDAPENGTQVGADNFVDNVQVSNGIFTVALDFGANSFANGAARFLEISVRAGTSTGGLTILAPRQQVTSAPFSLKTLSAANADALSPACVLCVTDGQIQTVDGSKVTGTVANAATATNISGIVPITNGGTGSATKNFVDLSTPQTIFGNKTFGNSVLFNSAVSFNNANPVSVSGELNVGGAVTAEQFVGSGEGLTNIPGLFKWQNISETVLQAQPNNGYLLTNDAQTAVSLPISPIVGDVFRVSGVGFGGWKIAQNVGQSIVGTEIGLIGLYWVARETNRNWSAIASSADGTKMFATVANGQIYTSFDGGINWTARETNRNWSSITSSADGTKLVATVFGGLIYTSTDSGATWTPRFTAGDWSSVASSADGTKLVLARTDGAVFKSTDSGITWTQGTTNSGVFRSVAISANGAKMAAVESGGRIYTSADTGATWTTRENFRDWRAIASSADGTKLVAIVDNGQIYTSIDSGVNWTPRETNRLWRAVAISTDGSKIFALVSGGQIFISTDAGTNWTTREGNRSWVSIAVSANNSKLAAAVSGGQLYISSPTTTIGTAGYLTGGQYSAVELQYIGSGQFMPISHSGIISGF